MAFKLTKAETAQRDDLVANLEIAGGILHAAIAEYNEAIAAAAEKANEAIAAYNEKLADAFNFREELVSRLMDEFDGRSEGWQAGDKGTAATEFMGAWDDVDLEPIEDVEAEPIDDLDLPHRDGLENAPDGTED